jgi:hypothetical protein
MVGMVGPTRAQPGTLSRMMCFRPMAATVMFRQTTPSATSDLCSYEMPLHRLVWLDRLWDKA